MKSELGKYTLVAEIAQSALKEWYESSMTSDRARPRIKEYQRQIDIILSPPPAFEPVELVRWECACCGTIVKGDCPEYKCAHGGEWVKLTGTVRREKRVPKERSVSLENVELGARGGLMHYPKQDYFGVFGNTEAAGKTGTLTFTWQEEP